MSVSPQPIKNLDQVMAQNPELIEQQRKDSSSFDQGFNPLIYGNDVDSVDIATRVAMVRFFNSPNVLANFSEETQSMPSVRLRQLGLRRTITDLVAGKLVVASETLTLEPYQMMVLVASRPG